MHAHAVCYRAQGKEACRVRVYVCDYRVATPCLLRPRRLRWRCGTCTPGGWFTATSRPPTCCSRAPHATPAAGPASSVTSAGEREDVLLTLREGCCPRTHRAGSDRASVPLTAQGRHRHTRMPHVSQNACTLAVRNCRCGCPICFACCSVRLMKDAGPDGALGFRVTHPLGTVGHMVR